MTSPVIEAPVRSADALAERLFAATQGALESLTIYMGIELGYYRALRDHGPLDAAGLARIAGTDERYAREWLEQQASCELIEHLPGTPDRFAIDPAHAEVLLDEASMAYMGWTARFVMSWANTLPRVIQASRDGSGVAYEQFGRDMLLGQAGANRPQFEQALPAEWFPQVPGLVERLEADPPARVADIGMGAGWSSISIARHYPRVQVDGYDMDAASVREADRNLQGSGVEDRVTFHCRDAGHPDAHGQYDLVTIFEALHDISRPVEVLATARQLLAEGGRVLIMDERVAETFAAPGDDTERFMYVCSVLHCLPASMADQPSAATGTVIRPGTIREYAAAAGFRSVEILPIENGFFRFYLLER
ncbi:MAG: methyltransferase domain-containing protein [Dehalococcoidia bacterium]|nr:methyltransferase domain-containing protein [Dehalococcoidia bacterium]